MSTTANRPDQPPVDEDFVTPDTQLPASPERELDPAKSLESYASTLLDDLGADRMASLRGLLRDINLPTLPQLEAPQEKSNVTLGTDGRVKIDYPEVAGQPKKSRELVSDGAGGYKEIITKTEGEGVSRMIKRDGNWFVSFHGMEFPMHGVKVDPNTYEVSLQVQPGLWQVESTDGKTQMSKANPDGSLVTLSDSGAAQKIMRTDNSSIEQRDANTIVETPPGGGKPVTWKKQGNEWVSDNGGKRTDFTLDKSGLTSYVNVGDGFTYKIAGDGSQIIEGAGRARITLDAQNRVKSIEWPDRKERRDFEYFGDSKDLSKIVKTDLARGVTYTNTRENAQSLKWDVKASDGSYIQPWYGKAQVGPGAAYSRLVTDSQGNANGKKWLTWWPDGKETHDTFDGQGTRTAYDENNKVLFREATSGARSAYDAAGNLSQVKTSDKTTFDIGADKIKMVDGVTGETVTFTKSGDTWTSDSRRFPGARKNLTVNEQGQLSYLNEAGERVNERRDNTKSVFRSGGVFEYNLRGDLTSISRGDWTRTFEMQNGQLKVTDTRAGQEPKVLFDTASEEGKKAKNVHFNKETGDVSWGTENGAVILRGNGLRIDLDQHGNQTRVTRPDNSSREFTYIAQKDGEGNETQVLAKITDRSAKGDVKEEWTAESDGQKVTSTFVNKPKEGEQPRKRENIEVCQDGQYKFKKPGEAGEHTARLGGDGNGMSADIDEARESLNEALRDKLDESQRVRFQAMMKQFEQRMADRLEARMAAGITPPEQIRKEVEQAVRGTYDNLTKMVSQPDDASKPTFYDQKTRVRLAENFMLHAMDPMTSDQGPSGRGEEGGHGTCWIQGAHVWGMVQHPDAMADLLRQVSIDGQYTTKNSGEGDATQKTVSFSKEMLAIKPHTQEARWTVDRAMQKWEEQPGFKREILGDRSPVGFIFDNVLPVIGGRQPGRIDGGNYETINAIRGHNPDGSYRTEKITGSSQILYMVTGDKPADYHTWNHPSHIKNHLLTRTGGETNDASAENFRRTLLEKGSILTHSMNHTSSRQIIKVNGQWMHVQDDQHGEDSDYVIGTISDLNEYVKGQENGIQRVSGTVAVPRVSIPGVVNDLAGPMNAVGGRPVPSQQWSRQAGGCPDGTCPRPGGGGGEFIDGEINPNPYRPNPDGEGGCRPCQPSWQPCRPMRRGGIFGGRGGCGIFRRCR